MNFKYNAVFEKKGQSVYISHLDLMMVLSRAIRRSGLPFVVTKGFTPKVKISIPKALKLGKESENEEMGLWFTEDVSGEVIKDRINCFLPEGVKIKDVSKS
ncbi:MAG: TIGR03936 family radical SAM-associated protein [Candidatus Omnitrophica bacterium]|nr:TIGR03936 family radical SAM-associated protein [Candidatus Omnitrophota bacterium]